MPNNKQLRGYNDML